MAFEFPFIRISKSPEAVTRPVAIRTQPRRGVVSRVVDAFRGQASGGNFFGRSRRSDTWAGGAERQDYNDDLTDSDGQVESRERIDLMKIGRRCFESIPHIKKAELLQARFCSPSSWESQVNDTEVALKITRYINRRMEASFFDLSENSSLPEMMEAASIDQGIDGDVFLNLVKPRDSQYSLIQPIRAHRVGDDATGFRDVSSEISQRFGIKSKPQKYREHSGVILDARNRRRAIRVFPIKRNSFLEIDTTDEGKVIPFGQVFQIYKPLHTDRVREVSTWNSSLSYARDVQEIWRYLNATLKSQVSAPIVTNTRTGKPPAKNAKPANGLNSLSRSNSAPVTDETPQLRKVVPGSVQYLRIGEEIKDFKAQRPNASFFDCMTHLYGTGAMAKDVPYPMIFDSKGYGGANLRFEIDQGGASLKSSREMRRKRFLDPWVRSMILEGIRNGELDLPASKLSELSVGTWYWPELPVADQKYNAKVAQDDYEFGFRSGNDITKPKGRSFIEIQRERGAEYEEKLNIAKDIHSRHPDRPLGEIIDSLGKPVNPNGSAIWEGIINDQKAIASEEGTKPAPAKQEDGKGAKALAATDEIEARLDDIEAQNAELLAMRGQFEQLELFADAEFAEA